MKSKKQNTSAVILNVKEGSSQMEMTTVNVCQGIVA